MSKSGAVFRNQFALFRREKGMIVFYLLSIIIIGVIVPAFVRNVESALSFAAFLTAMYLKPMLADSLAGEREHKTLETLLSSPMTGKSVVWGKVRFCFSFAVVFWGLTAICGAVTIWLFGSETGLAAWQWSGVIFLAIFSFCAICCAGVYTSATSGDLRTANSRISLIAYPLGLLFFVYIAVVAAVDFLPALIISGGLALLYLVVILFYAVRISRMKQSDYYENIKLKKAKMPQGDMASGIQPKSQVGIVFSFELKYMMTLKKLLFNFGILCCGPALIACLLPMLTGELDLNFAVFITVMVIPRIPMNLIAYSIGGEKVYKTGESLLSTPLHIRPVFIAKCMVPLLVSAIMLAASSLLTLIGANITAWATTGTAPLYLFTASQLVLLFPVGILSSMMMMFLSAIFSVALKTPRQGLYVSSVISYLFVIPALGIVYLANNIMLWSVVYTIVLLIGNAICIGAISDKITRPQIMSRL